MSNKFIIVGDVHLGKYLSVGRPESGIRLNSRVADTVNLLDWILEIAFDGGIDNIIFTGDIFEDIRPDYKYVILFLEFLQFCQSNNINIHIVAGNHDMKRVGTEMCSALDIYQKGNFATVYKTFDTIILDGVGITMIPYRDREWLQCKDIDSALLLIKNQLEEQASMIPSDYYKVAIGHLAIEGSIFVGDESDSLTNQIMCPISFFKDYDFTWMGHVHKYQVISKIPFVSHVGSLNISDFGEAGAEKNIIVFDIDQYPIYNVIPIPIRQLRKISVSVPKEQNSTEFVLNEIKNMHDILSMRDVTVKVEIKLNDQKAESINRDLIEKFLYNIGVHYISNISESKAISVVDLEKVESVDNSITPEKAIKIFAEHESFESEDDRERYLKFAAEIIEQQKVKK